MEWRWEERMGGEIARAIVGPMGGRRWYVDKAHGHGGLSGGRTHNADAWDGIFAVGGLS